MNDMSVGVRVAANGRMVLPVAVRRAMGLTGDTKVVLKVKDGKVTLSSLAENVRWAQEMYRKHAKSGRTVDDFLRDRHAGEDRRDALLSGKLDQ